MGLFTALLLVFHVNYLPWHLARECHLALPVSESHPLAAADCGHRLACCPHQHDGEEEHHHDHVPHPASEHAFVAFAKLPDALATVDAVASSSQFLIAPPAATVEIAAAEDDGSPPRRFTPNFAPRGPPAV